MFHYPTLPVAHDCYVKARISRHRGVLPNKASNHLCESSCTGGTGAAAAAASSCAAAPVPASPARNLSFQCLDRALRGGVLRLQHAQQLQCRLELLHERVEAPRELVDDGRRLAGR